MSPTSLPPATTSRMIPAAKVNEFVRDVLELEPDQVIAVHMMGGSITAQIYVDVELDKTSSPLTEIMAKHPRLAMRGNSVSIEATAVFHVDPERT